jgi:lipoprotein NlpI
MRHATQSAMARWCVAGWWFLSLAAAAGADEPPLPAARGRELQAAWERTIREASAVLEQNPRDLTAYSRRGDAYFFSGQFAAAIADYDRMVELDPSLDAAHWRRGIACFYAGRYADAAAQFERYHTFDNVDRENGIWRYLSQVKAQGKEQARAGLLKYAKDDREPFPAVYEMFAGRMSAEQILEQIARADISPAEREKRRFYADLYIGLYEWVEERPESAQRHLARAVRNSWGPQGGYGPHYMWHVARLHEASLREAKK